MDTAKVIEVVETTLTRRGDGSERSGRVVTQYWSREGELLAESDPWNEYEDAIGRLTAFLMRRFPGEIRADDLPCPAMAVGVAMRLLTPPPCPDCLGTGFKMTDGKTERCAHEPRQPEQADAP